MSYEQLADSVDGLHTQVTGLTQGVQDAIARVAKLTKVNTTYPFAFVPGTVQYDVKVISGDAEATTAGMALWVEGSIVYPTVDDSSKFTLQETEHYSATTQIKLIVNARYDDLLTTVDEAYQGEKVVRTTDYYSYLNQLQLEPAVPYAPGLSLIRPTQTVTQSGVLYRPLATALPIVTSNWVADVTKFVVANDMSLRDELSATGGVVHVSGARRVVNLREYCTGNFNWATLTGTSNTLDWRRAVADCGQDGIIMGEPGQVYYLDMQADGVVVDIINKGLTIDLQGASVAYKPYLDSNKAGTAAPALYFASTEKTVYTATSGMAFGTNVVPLSDASGIVEGDYLVVSSNDLMYPWNYPDSSQAGILIGSDVVKVRKVVGNVVSLYGCIQHEHVLAPTVTKVKMLEGVKVKNIGPLSGEVDPGVLKTFAAGKRAGHFISICDAARPEVEEIQLLKGHRMFATCFTGCYTPQAKAIRSASSNPLYRPNGGHQYTVGLVTCFGAFVDKCQGYGVRHTYDITDCTGTHTQNNLAFDNYGGFNTHGHRDYGWKSVDDTCMNGTDSDNAGWTVGNYSFRNSDNVKLIRPYYRGGGIPITIGFMSTEVTVEDPDIITSSPQAFVVASGAGKIKARLGSIRSTSTNPNPTVLLGYDYSIDLGSMTFAASAGTNPVVTVTGTKAHGLAVAQEIWLALPDAGSGQYTGRYVVASVNTLSFTATPATTLTTTVALSLTTGWSSMNGRVTKYGNFKPIGDVEISCAVTKSIASQLGVVSYSGNGRLKVGNSITSLASSRYPIRLHGLLTSVPPSFEVNNLQILGDHWSVVSLDNVLIGARCTFTKVTSNSHTQYALQAFGSSLASLQGAGLTFTDNVLETTAAAGVLNFHPFPVMFANPGKLLIRGNVYGTGYTTEYGYNYEFGSWTPKAGAATITTQPTYANQIGRYSFDGVTLNITLRVEWSGLVGTGDAYVDGLPFVFAPPFNQPVNVAEFYVGSMVGGDVPTLSFNYQSRLLLRKLNGVTTSPFTAPSVVRLVASCSIPVC